MYTLLREIQKKRHSQSGLEGENVCELCVRARAHVCMSCVCMCVCSCVCVCVRVFMFAGHWRYVENSGKEAVLDSNSSGLHLSSISPGASHHYPSIHQHITMAFHCIP